MHVAFGQKSAVITLPPPPGVGPGAIYEPVVQSGKLLFVSGAVPFVNGQIPKHFAGPVQNTDPEIERGQKAAERAVLNSLSNLYQYLGGSFDRINRIVRLTVYVQSAPDFNKQHLVANGASKKLIEAFGEAGKSARSAIGVNMLPLNASAEVELIVELKDDTPISPPPKMADTQFKLNQIA